MSESTKALKPAHQKLLQFVFDRFRATGAWPSVRKTRLAMVDDGDLGDLCAALGSTFIVCTGIDDQPTSTCELRLRALLHVANAETDAERVVTAIQYLARRYLEADTDGEVQVTVGEFGNALKLANEDVYRVVIWLRYAPMVLRNFGPNLLNPSAELTIDYEITRLKNIVTLDDYFRVCDEIQASRSAVAIQRGGKARLEGRVPHGQMVAPASGVRDAHPIQTDRLLLKLKTILDSKNEVEETGANSPEAVEWFASARAHIELVDQRLAAEFVQLMYKVNLPLSPLTLGPLWANMLGLIKTAIARLELQVPQTSAKVYGPGDAYDLYRDIAEIVKAARSEVFVIDPYANEELFDLYFKKAHPSVRVRLLTSAPSNALRSIARKFKARKGVKFEARASNETHDRVVFIDGTDCWVLGQSVKDAAMKKPTYLIPVDAVSDMARLYEEAWNRATPF